MKQWMNEIDAVERDVTRRLQEREPHLFDCGDDTYLRIFPDSGPADYTEATETIRTRFPGAVVREWEICGNRFLCAERESGYLYVICIPCRRELRLLYAAEGKPIPQQLGDRSAYAGERRVTQLSPDAAAQNFGMCYVLSLGEGHFLLYDGLGSAGQDEEKLWQVLLQDTPGGQKPVIDAWILTHPHYDHIAGVHKFALRYAGEVQVRNLIMNMADPRSFPIRLWREVADCYACWLPGIRRAFPDAAVWKAHTGQRFAVGPAEVEVLLTQEEVYPGELIVNDTSLVTRVFLNGKRLFFPADISGESECRLLHDMYGEYLRSEFYQIAHHAWDTEALLFYADVDPQTLFWPLRLKDWEPSNRMWTFPATKVMKQEMEEKRREFLIAQGENITVTL